MLDASLEEIARSKGVAMVYNNRRLLRESGERSLDEYFSGEFSHSHPNDKGYAVMADEIYNHLRMSGYFRSVYI
jgi:lysophospholipase L1-like esterase